MYIDKNMILRIKKDLEMKKQETIDRRHIFYSYLNRKGYETPYCQKDMRRKIARCERDLENYKYLDYIINEIEKENDLHNLDTLTQKKIKVCVKVKDYSQERLKDV